MSARLVISYVGVDGGTGSYVRENPTGVPSKGTLVRIPGVAGRLQVVEVELDLRTGEDRWMCRAVAVPHGSATLEA